jgi:hypothetical protein
MALVWVVEVTSTVIGFGCRIIVEAVSTVLGFGRGIIREVSLTTTGLALFQSAPFAI